MANPSGRTPSLEGVIAKVFEVEPGQLNDDTTPDDVDKWDSMGHFALVAELEAVYGVTVSPDDVVGMLSVGDVRAVLRVHGVDV